MMHPVLEFYSRHFGIKLTPEQEELVLKAYRKIDYKKKTTIFRRGESNTKHYIIEKGLLRLYLIDTKGKEINILFAKENQVIGDLSTPQATDFFLETMEDSIVYSISDQGMQRVAKKIGDGKAHITDNGMRRSYIHIQKRLVALLSNSAEENYLFFQNNYPDLIQRLPQYHIASFLGVSAEFLSKIIARTVKPKK
jgi:CRP-like cAMP-binding protein